MSTQSLKGEKIIRRFQIDKDTIQKIRKEVRRQQVVTFILFIIFLFQLVSLPGAMMMQSLLSIGTVIFGLVLCAVAMLFNRKGKVTIVSILLILTVDSGCGLMLLTPGMNMASMGSMPSSSSMSAMGKMPDMGKMPAITLDASEFPTFDLLVVSELIAVSLLPAASVFWVAFSNILFILVMMAFLPHTAELNLLLKSSMAYSALAQPISLQLVVAAITYLWVNSALRAAVRADLAEEIVALQQSRAMLQQQEIEQKRLLDIGISELLEGMAQGANGQEVTINLRQDHMLWKVGNAVNFLLARLRRARQVDLENKLLRAQIVQMRERLLEARFLGFQDPSDTFKPKKGNSWTGL